ncbi:glycosyltransferase family 2 protein [Flavobacteriaceae bacterium]|jgi:GT2 family glycosyltransferase|nr:glycosyltransferase family 2 protein [Flavobacteriaceae bacterium]MDC1491732.1 glycosyltransferase family 2 protein [Flavobacteriaceae bacterium]
MKLAIVVLNWNGVKLLEKFLNPLINHNNHDAHIYIIDNNSSDDSVDYVKSNFPSIKIIRNKENYGYAKGYNEGLKNINADVFCLLNNDIEVTNNWLDSIINEFKLNSTTAAIQPKILNYKNRDYFDYAGAAGGYLDCFGYPYCDGRVHNIIEKDEKQFDYDKDIFWASGACLFIRKEVFFSLNGFDESFFNHMEEIDLCWRILKRGFKIKYIYKSKVFHVGGATLDYNNPKKTFYNFRNSLFTITKNIEKNLVITLFFKMVIDGLIGIHYLITFKFQHLLAIIKAHFAFYNQMPKLIKQRQSTDSNLKDFKSTFLAAKYLKLKYVKFFSN